MNATVQSVGSSRRIFTNMAEIGKASLLTRMSEPRPAGGVSAGGRAEGLRSILRNLGDVLNTRQGTAAAQMDLGTLAPCDAMDAHHSMTDRLQRSLREVITRYEPRLKDVDVVYVRRPHEGFHLHFQVSARLVAAESEAIAFSTLVDVAGRVTLRE